MRLRVLGLSWLGAAFAAHAAGPHQIGYDSLKQLVLDTRVIERVENARLVFGTPEKEPRNPLFKADQPWENATNNLYPNIIWDEQEQIFKLWYSDVLVDQEVIAQMDRPSTINGVGWYLLNATSRDGLTWQKPALGLHGFNGSKANNIVARDLPGVGVFKDPHDSNAARRYKLLSGVSGGRPRVCFSADGMHWSEPIEAKGFSDVQGDTHNNAFWDARIGKYVWISKLYIGERLVARLESDDFITWKSSGMVLRSTVEEGRSSQTYCLPVFPYGNIYLGYAMMYHLGKDRAVDCELAWSHDGVRWQRLAPGTPFIPRGPPGSYDAGCIYAQAGPATAQDGRLLIYYGGSDVPHIGWKRHCLPSLARLRVDGFAGYEAIDGSKPAVLTTRPVTVVKERLSLSADADGGSVLVELVDEQNRLLAKSRPVVGTVTDQPAELDLKPFIGRTARIRFTLDRARLYAFGGVTLVQTEMPVAEVAPLRRWPVRTEAIRVAFDQNSDGWSGPETVEHHPAQGADGGFITISRANRPKPAARNSPFAGDWPALIGGEAATIAVQVRAPHPGAVKIELFAQDTAWSHRTRQVVSSRWQTVTVPLRYDWTDGDATAAGWIRSPSAFSWRDTIRHVGRLHVTFAAEQADPTESFDLAAIEVHGK